MTPLNEIKTILFWCTSINYAILIVWFIVFLAAHDWLFNLHRRWFDLTRQSFDAVHYGGMAIYKLGIMLFNLVPLMALYFVK